MVVTPRSPYILVKEIGETKTQGGLFVPPGEDKKSLALAVVVQDSDAYEGEVLEIGDKVYLAPGAGYHITSNGEPHILVKADDILAVTK